MRFGFLRTFIVRLTMIAVCIPWGLAAADDDSATLVIYRPKRFTSSAVASAYRVNGQSLGKFKHGVFEVQVEPGSHEVRSFFPASKEEKFDLKGGALEWGTYAVEIEATAGATVWVHQTSGGELEVIGRDEFGDKFDKASRHTPAVARIEGTFVSSSETRAWERCSGGSALECRKYLERFPYGAFVAEANEAVAVAAPDPEPETVASIPARTRSLPVGIQRDKYMLSLTASLKEERYADSLVFFSELEKLDVELSPSFWFYYGEALYQTGDYSGAIDKLYAYVAEAGKAGEHYQRALELSIEAEER